MKDNSHLTNALLNATARDLATVLAELGIDRIELSASAAKTSVMIYSTLQRKRWQGQTVMEAVDEKTGRASQGRVATRLGLDG